MPSDKPVVSVRLPDDLLAYVDGVAAEADRSRNWVIVAIIRDHMNMALAATAEERPVDGFFAKHAGLFGTPTGDPQPRK